MGLCQAIETIFLKSFFAVAFPVFDILRKMNYNRKVFALIASKRGFCQ